MKLAGILSVALIYTATAATYYVDSSGGNDAASGSSPATAWKTLGHAQTNLSTGDTVLLNRGSSFTEQFTFPHDNITIDAYGTGALPIITGSGVNRWGVYAVGVTGTITRNLNIKDVGGLAPPNETGALWQTDSGTNTITDCVLDHHLSDDDVAVNGSVGIVQRCTIINAYDQGVTMHGIGRLTIDSCVISNCLVAFKNSGSDLAITANEIVMENNGNDIDALDVCPATFNRCRFLGRSDSATWAFFKANTSTVTFNYCTFDGSRSTGATGAPQFVVNSPTFINNCVFYAGGKGDMVVNAGKTLTATNCIFSSWYRGAYVDTGGAFNADHCIFYAITTGTRTSANEVSGDPLFVASGTDFHLRSGSPAIRAGIYIGGGIDLDGLSMHNPPDLGAYKYGSIARASNVRVGMIRGK